VDHLTAGSRDLVGHPAAAEVIDSTGFADSERVVVDYPRVHPVAVHYLGRLVENLEGVPLVFD